MTRGRRDPRMPSGLLAGTSGALLLSLVGASVACAGEVEIHVQGASISEALPSAVFLRAVSGRFTPVPGTTAVVDQIHRQFVPQVSIVEVGTAVSFPNKDDIRHHVYSFSVSKPFELKLYSGKPSAPVVFDRPGLVTLGCNIHDQMLAYVLVVDSRWHAIADSQGRVRLGKVPPGDYEVHAWSPGGRAGEHPVQQLHVGPDATLIHVEVPPRTAEAP